MGYLPRSNREEGRYWLTGVISTIRSKNGMDQISSKGKDKIQDKKEKSMCEDTLDEVVVSGTLATLGAMAAKGAALAAKAGAAGAKGAAAAGKVGAKVGSVAGKAAKATGKASAKVSKALPPAKSQPASSDSGIDLGGVKDTGVKVAKKVIDTGVNMVKKPLGQSFKTLTTNEELSIDDQMKIAS